ncbi:MAG: hypothetical protein WAV95_07015 [Azonexus sp.]
MDIAKITIDMLLIAGAVVAALLALPYLSSRLSRPVWAIPKTVVEFIAMWILCSLLIPWILALGVAVVLAMFRHQSRLARHRNLLAAEAEGCGSASQAD